MRNPAVPLGSLRGLGCAERNIPILRMAGLAIPVHRIATLAGSNPPRPISAESAIWRDIPVADATAAFDSDGMKVAVANAPIFAHTTEALVSRLPTVNS
jgi:hypothetical protein